MNIVFLAAGIIIGCAIAFFYAKSKFKLPGNVTLDSFNSLDRQKSILEESMRKATEDLIKADVIVADERKKNSLLTADVSRLQTELKNMDANIQNNKNELDELQKKFKTEFENLANKILEEKTKTFTETNRTNLDVILNPLKEKIKDFEEKVQKAYDTESKERFSLQNEIKNLLTMNKQLSEEANNLATALKGDNKKSGNWGEMVLEKILEASGLIKNQEYRAQVVAENADGEKIKPDFIVYLPDEKHLIVDSKVSLLSYANYTASQTDEDRARFSKQHVDSVRSHIKLLGEKNYYSAKGFNTPDFVLLFMPIESAFSLALQGDNEMYNYAWDRKIVIVSPTTLLATLRTIASIWKQERQNKYALQIAEEGGKMYDKLVSFLDDLICIGKKMDEAKVNYGEAMKKLYDGSGNLIGRANKMKELGAKATKNIPQPLIDRANEMQIGE